MTFDPNNLFYVMLKILIENNAFNKEKLETSVKIFNEGGSRCFSKDTLIVTDSGLKKISEIQQGDKVKTFNEETKYNEFKTVNSVYHFKNNKPCLKVKLKNGTEIIATEDHQFYHEGEWIALKNIIQFWVDVESVESISLNDVYDLSVCDNHNYYINAGGDILAHNSSKTIDTVHLIYYIFEQNRNAGLECYVFRNTLTNCRDYTLKDFQTGFNKMGVRPEIITTSPKPYINLFGNHIYFRGLDGDMEATGSDILFFNELLEVESKEKISGWLMRCRMFTVADWNPKYTIHWAFGYEGQPNCFFTHTTYKDNKHLEKSIVNEIESYNPGDPENIKNNTADDYRWKVYGLGIRCAPEGLIYQNVNYIDEWPVNIAPVRGLDFGFTNDPSALVNYGENKTDCYIELLMYEPTENASIIHDYALANDIDFRVPCTADSSDRYTAENKGTVRMVQDLEALGWNIEKVSKKKNNMYWIGKMKEKNINIVKNNLVHFARREQENYRFKTVNGIAINQPVDDFNHFWDAAKYAKMSLYMGEEYL